MKKDFITPKLVVALDRCQLSMRDSLFILEATIDVLGCNIDEFLISTCVVTFHSDGKLLSALSARKSKEERLPTVISFGLKEQLIVVPRLDNSTGKEQVQAFWKAILDWNLEDKVQILCCDTTASNTGRFNGVCALLEQTFYREMLFFACRHHVYELVLKAVFEVKFKQVTTSPIFHSLKSSKIIGKTSISLKCSAIEKQWNYSEPYPNLKICLTFTALNLKMLWSEMTIES
ncbi:hypothetical protein AVEN_230319-1 [Araneus ventricosus]|uniref:Uncharacterized protein n=1 Tax=Araneus ventricosus TaxID=182803 RepID=A0A4Y2SQJ5_ARAVE|nr:hypothetical protein AVEN_230319-1 [Araneus ventricosus]